MQVNKSRVCKYILYSILAILVIYVASYTYHAILFIMCPYAMDVGGEGFVLNQAYLLSQGHHLYHDISTYPYTTAVYPPLYPLLCAPLIKLFGVSLAVGRVVSFAAALLVGLLTYKIVRDITQNRTIATVSSLLFLASPYVYDWTVLFRVDTLGLLFSLLGIYVVFRHENSRKVYWSIPFFVLAFYTKQSYLAAPMAALVFLFLKDRRLAVTYLAILVGSAGFTFLLANWLTGGQFYLHTVRYNMLSFDILRGAAGYLRMVLLHAVLVGGAAFFVWRSLSERRSALSFLRSRKGLLAIYFVVSALTALSIGRTGASWYYFLELVVVSSILLGVCLSELRPQIERSRARLGLVAVLLVAQLLIFLPDHLESITLPKFDRSVGEKVSAYVRSASGDVLCKDATFAVLNGKEVAIDFFLFSELSRRGVWDQGVFLKDLENKRFSVAVLHFDVESDEATPYGVHVRCTPEMIEGLRENYELVETIGPNYVYQPKLSE